MSKLNEQQKKAFADILLKVPSVGPQTATLLLGIYDGLMKQKAIVKARNAEDLVFSELERYADSLWTVLGFLALHQKTVINQLECFIKEAKKKDGQGH